MENKILISKTRETSIHVSLHVPTIVDLSLDVTRRSSRNYCEFFKPKKNIERQPLLAIEPDESDIVVRL